MKVRVDVYVGDKNEFDTSFLERRTHWLPYTGIYLEFILKGVYDEKLDFQVTSSAPEAILVSRHSWNRFFLNIQGTGSVEFAVIRDGKSCIEKTLDFDVVNSDVPLLFSVPSLVSFPISDVRFFANRLSENLVNGTRINLFTAKQLETLMQCEFKLDDSVLWRLLELIFSILTERGLVVFLSPFNSEMGYPLEMLQKLREVLFWCVERGMKFRIVWDLCSGLRKRELESMIDALVGRFGHDISLAVSPECINKVGGEGFSHIFKEFKDKADIPENERGVKIARYQGKADYYGLRSFTRRAATSGWGTEYLYLNPNKHLRKIRYSLSRALYQGYQDTKEAPQK